MTAHRNRPERPGRARSSGWDAPAALSQNIMNIASPIRRILLTVALALTASTTIATPANAAPISTPVITTQINNTATNFGEDIFVTLTLAGMEGAEQANVDIQLFDLSVDPAAAGSPLDSFTLNGITNGTHFWVGVHTVYLNLEGHTLSYRTRISSTSDGVGVGAWSTLGDPTSTADVNARPLGYDMYNAYGGANVGMETFASVWFHSVGVGNTVTVQFQLFDLTLDPTGTGAPLVDETNPGIVDGFNYPFAKYVILPSQLNHTLGYRTRILASPAGTFGWTALGANYSTTLVYPTRNTSVKLTKQASASPTGPWSDTATVAFGAPTYWRLTVTNDGDLKNYNFKFTDVTTPDCVTAGNAAVAAAAAAANPVDPDGLILLPGESFNFVCSTPATVAGVTNTASVSVDALERTTIGGNGTRASTSTATATVLVPAPATTTTTAGTTTTVGDSGSNVPVATTTTLDIAIEPLPSIVTTTQPKGLPTTGTDTGTMLAVAFTVLFAGLILLVVRRRRVA